jgi:hypothetical protein
MVLSRTALLTGNQIFGIKEREGEVETHCGIEVCTGVSCGTSRMSWSMASLCRLASTFRLSGFECELSTSNFLLNISFRSLARLIREVHANRAVGFQDTVSVYIVSVKSEGTYTFDGLMRNETCL